MYYVVLEKHKENIKIKIEAANKRILNLYQVTLA